MKTIQPGTLYKYRQHRRSLPNKKWGTFKQPVDIRGVSLEKTWKPIMLPDDAICMYLKTITKDLLWSASMKIINGINTDIVEYRAVDRLLFLYENYIIEFPTDAVIPFYASLLGSSAYLSDDLKQNMMLKNPPLLTPIAGEEEEVVLVSGV